MLRNRLLFKKKRENKGKLPLSYLVILNSSTTKQKTVETLFELTDD